MSYSEYHDAVSAANITVNNEEIKGLYDFLSSKFNYDSLRYTTLDYRGAAVATAQ